MNISDIGVTIVSPTTATPRESAAPRPVEPAGPVADRNNSTVSSESVVAPSTEKAATTSGYGEVVDIRV